jgi:hypothetical protein
MFKLLHMDLFSAKFTFKNTTSLCAAANLHNCKTHKGIKQVFEMSNGKFQWKPLTQQTEANSATGPLYLGIKSSTRTTPCGIKVNNNQLVTGICKSIHKLLCGMDVLETCSPVSLPPSHTITNFCLCPHLHRPHDTSLSGTTKPLLCQQQSLCH